MVKIHPPAPFLKGNIVAYEEILEKLATLERLWLKEKQTAWETFAEERRQKTQKERVERGLALQDLTIVETDAAPGGRLLLWLSPRKGGDLDSLRIGPGDPVRLWWDDPDSEEAVCAVVARRQADRLSVMVDDLPERLEEGSFHLDKDDPQATFKRGLQAIQRWKEAKAGTALFRQRSIFYADEKPTFSPRPALQRLDQAINPSQWEAVLHALSADSIALIQGPPGTGKTRTLVEIIRQGVLRGEKILATAASNTAVDTLAERCLASGLRLIRLGHPARVSEALVGQTLEVKLENDPDAALARGWIREARKLQQTLERRKVRGNLSRDERKELQQEVHRLYRDARLHLKSVQEKLLSQAQVIFCTAAGADSFLLGTLDFDRVVLDEATQAVDPLALFALHRAPKIVMAGDQKQLPPTVLDRDAEKEGLGETLFDRLIRRFQDTVSRMLTIQYRMHEAIMAFPSKTFYDGRLQADPSVAAHLLHELDGVAFDPSREEPLIFIDTAGTGWQEEKRDDDPSTQNLGSAQRIDAEIRRLLGRGLKPSDVAIITPYDAQVRLLRDRLTDLFRQGLEIGSVDGFQGREKEAILLDLVRSNDHGDLGFLTDLRRINVALTRARRFLLVLGDSATLASHPFYTSWLDASQAQGGWKSAWDDDAPPFQRNERMA